MSSTFSRRSGLAWSAAALAAFGCRSASDLPSLGGVGAFTLTDQSGAEFTPQTLKGRVWAAAFMFTRCPTVCPRITRRMRELQRAAKREDVALELVSFSVDPENDTPRVLRAYAQQYGADLTSWRFLTGDLEVVRRTSEQGFKLAFEGKPNASAEHYGLMHGSHLVLVDGAAQIRGYYRTSEDQQMTQLLKDAALLS